MVQQTSNCATVLALARQKIAQRNYPAAEKLLMQVLRDEPENIQANLSLANILIMFGGEDRAGDFLETVLRKDPWNFEARTKLAHLYHHFGKLGQIGPVLEPLVGRLTDIHGLQVLAERARLIAQFSISIQALRKILVAQPSSAATHGQLGSLYLITGDTRRAREHLEKAISLDARMTQPLFKLSQLQETGPDSDVVRRLEELHADPEGLLPEQKMYLLYGLGKAREDAQRYDEAIDFLIEANRMEGIEKPYDENLVKTLFQATREEFSLQFFRQNKRFGSQSECPILVVGMPRSGTSLTEQILSSHPTIFGAGELGDFERMAYRVQSETGKSYPKAIGEVSQETLRDMAGRYLNKLAALSAGAERVVDKMPHNFVYAGLVSLLFPNARIIHCRRNPMDTCLSIFKSVFGSQHPYSHDLATMGRYYREYLQLMDHWKQVLPSTIYEIHYEKLVENPEAEIRALLDYCGLPFDAACLEFHKTRRSVDTVSHNQVRQPINTNSVSGWRHYERQMQPFIDALGEDHALAGYLAGTPGD